MPVEKWLWFGFSGTKYDIDFKSQNKLGQNFKSGQDMINMYKELCTGMPFILVSQRILSTMAAYNLLWLSKTIQ